MVSLAAGVTPNAARTPSPAPHAPRLCIPSSRRIIAVGRMLKIVPPAEGLLARPAIFLEIEYDSTTFDLEVP